MRIIKFTLFLLLAPLAALADSVNITWPMTNMENLGDVQLTPSSEYVSASFTLGKQLTATALMTAPNADDGYTATAYDPAFVQLTPSTRVTAKTTGHFVAFTVKAAQNHSFKPISIEFDAVKCGTDGGNFDVYIRSASTTETALETGVSPLRNKIGASNQNGYSHHTYLVPDQIVRNGETFQLILYVYNFNGQDDNNPKSIAFRNVTIDGEIDEPIYEASHYFTVVECSKGSLLDIVKTLKNGESATYPEKCYGDPTDFSVTAAEGYEATIEYANKVATLTAKKGGKDVFSCFVRFVVSNVQPRSDAKPLNRGLMAVKVNGGVLVSWRSRASDEGKNLRFRLWRNGKFQIKNNAAPDGCITSRTNWLDASGTTTSTYKLEVLDADGNVIETQEDVPTWSNQTKYITLQGGAPTDPTTAGATYTPNDASFCDMDGDGEYEIILKWAPSNEKDAASSGVTSPAFYACYKLDGTRLWMLTTGPNMFNSAHTTPFIAWDLDGDGYGEFMVKTAPGTIDGEGNYVLLPGDNPTDNLKGGKGKQDHGSEYITVFDGVTGAELKTIKYHTAYGDETSSFWGDSNQNRSERYLAAIAWLDGEDANPSAIFARGYYSGCKIGAYDWDGSELTLRWLHRGTGANSGTVTYANGSVKNLTTSVYGEGAHWICVGDVTGDGKQEIHYGSGALKPDGTTLYRTGFGHGDAMHLSDFVPSRPGLEYFMVHEHSPYGADLRDAKTGEVIWRTTASGDTGRGIMAHFNPESDDAYWQSSADANLYDTGRNVIAENVTHGGGAGLSFRIFWNGTLADDFYGKNVIEYWNPDEKAFWRMQINGANYVVGNYNNSSKQNPCVSGDLMGDWREEIVTWDQSGNDYRLIINATDYQTDYMIPHLMDNFAYRAQLIGQNVVYNQPPHLPYNLISTYTREFTIGEDGWDVFYTPYPVTVPSGITAYRVAGVNKTTQIVSKVAIPAGSTISAGASIIVKGTSGKTVSFRPSTKTPLNISNSYLKGDFVTQKLTASSDNVHFYQLQPSGEPGIMVFKPVPSGTMQPACTPWLQVTGAVTENYCFFLDANAIPTGVDAIRQGSTKETIYDITGRKIANDKLPHGIYIQDGQKIIK